MKIVLSFPFSRLWRSTMQSCVYKSLFSYSVSRRLAVRVFHHADKRCAANKPPATLNHRFIKYLEEAASLEMSLETKLNAESQTNEINYPRLETTPDNAVCNVSSIVDEIQRLKIIHDPVEIKSQLSIIDNDICALINDLSFDEILLLLNKLMEIVPRKLAALDAFSKGIERLKSLLSAGSLSSDKIVNLLFVASLTKTAAARDISFVLKHLPDFEELSLIERCIVSMVTFKAGIKLGRKNIQVIEDTIHENLDLLFAEPGLLVSLLKALRFAGPSPEFSLTPISKRLLESKSRYRISMAVPILALYAEMLKLEKKVVRRLVRDSISDISRWRNSTGAADQDAEYFLDVRTKDVDRLLWATSRLNHRLSKDQLTELDKFVDTRLGILANNPRVFAGVLLSLWMLRSSKCQEKVEYCFREKVFEPLLNAPQEDQARLDLLLECVRVEAPGIEIPSAFEREIPHKSIKTCRELVTVSELLKCLGEEHLALTDTQIDCPAKGIRIYGISTRHRSLGWIHIDLLNNITCLKDTRKPNGLMCLKLRLVKKMGYFSILLDNDGVIRIESMIAIIEQRINSKLEKKTLGV